LKNIKRFRRYVCRDLFSIFIPDFYYLYFYLIHIPESRRHKAPVVKYPRFKAPIVVIGSLIWVEIRTQNDSTCFMRVQVADKAMANMNRRRISGTLYDKQSDAKA
jgi:hypothetical protein